MIIINNGPHININEGDCPLCHYDDCHEAPYINIIGDEDDPSFVIIIMMMVVKIIVEI